MNAASPELLPIFRSLGQARLLARVYLGEPATIAQLARELGLDDGGLTREADRLERAGLVYSERVGRSRVLHAHRDSPYYEDLYKLLLKALGPAAAVGEELARIEGVESAYIHGSWAARYAGEPGPDPADIDVIAIGAPTSGLELTRAATKLSERLGRDVHITVVARPDWEAADTGFVREIRARPLVAVDLDRPPT